jgi:two-component system, OmpR family, phosphate regulon response regulator PhoB
MIAAMPSAPSPDSVLVVDDEPDLCRLLVFNLVEAGFRTHTATTGMEGLTAASMLRPTVVILDLMLPDLPGAEVCRRLRADATLSDVAILMLTARGDDYDRVMGFELGADDYVVKPYNVREVVLRVRALARRAGERLSARAAPRSSGKELGWRGLRVETSSHRVTVDGAELALRPLEFKLLTMLLDHPGRVLSRELLLEEVWGINGEVNTRTVDTHVRRLRERLGSYGEAVETVYGLGYKLRDV